MYVKIGLLKFAKINDTKLTVIAIDYVMSVQFDNIKTTFYCTMLLFAVPSFLSDMNSQSIGLFE